MGKGISAVIAAILLLLITIAVLGMAFVSLQRTTQAAANATETITGTTAAQAGYNFRIETVDYLSSIVNLRNTGTARLENLAIYVNGQQTTATYTPISPSTTGDLLLDQPLYEGKNIIRITAGVTEQVIVVDVPSTWFADFTVTGS